MPQSSKNGSRPLFYSEQSQIRSDFHTLIATYNTLSEKHSKSGIIKHIFIRLLIRINTEYSILSPNIRKQHLYVEERVPMNASSGVASPETNVAQQLKSVNGNSVCLSLFNYGTCHITCCQITDSKSKVHLRLFYCNASREMQSS